MSESVNHTLLIRNPGGTVSAQHLCPSHRVLAETVDLPVEWAWKR